MTDTNIIKLVENLHHYIEANNKILSALRTDFAFYAMDDDKILKIHEDGKVIKFYLPLADRDLIQRKILSSFSFFEIGLLRKIKPLIVDMKNVLDIGANIGNHSLFFSKVCNISNIDCFEPMPITFGILKKNIDINNCKSVNLHDFALGAINGSCSISEFKPANFGGTSFKPDLEGSFTIKTLDSLMIRNVDFMKIDVEGQHVDFLKGASETINESKPLIFIELRKSKGEFDTGYEMLKKMGYSLSNELDQNNFIFSKDNHNSSIYL